MALTRTLGFAGIALLAASLLAATLLISLAVTASPAGAQTATGASCGGVTLSPASRTVRRGGQVLLKGQACGASASSSGSDSVQVKIRKGKRWGIIGSAQASDDGSFEVCAKVVVPRRAKVARLQATSTSGATGVATVRVSNRGASSCETSDGGDQDTGGSSGGGGGGYTSPPPEQGNPDCPLAQPGSTISLTLPSSCTVVASDTASNADPLPFWGKIDAAAASRHQQVGSGGDTHQTALGTSQGNSAFRKMTVLDGDDVWGERAELGLNDSPTGPTVLYHEGQRRVTFMSIRLPTSWDVNDPDWRMVTQMKQAQPYHTSAYASMFEVQVRSGSYNIISNWSEPLWTVPAQTGVWTRFAFDIVYSQDPSVGSITVYVDKNGDGDATDAGEKSPTIQRQTLAIEDGGGSGPIPPGGSIPSHLRAGVYQNTNYNCPGPTGCSAEYDNIQVVKA